jgi:hypothetical protein
MLWVGCVLPAGTLADATVLEDFRTPIHRAPVLLVPGMLLLIVAPVGASIARTSVGLRAILASMDAFVCIYAAIALAVLDPCPGPTFVVLQGTLAVLGLLSVAEVVRWTRSALPGRELPRPAGVRLAIATLVLLMPSWLLVVRGCELASILAPFAFVAISAAGVRIARTQKGVRLAAALLHVAIAAHILVTLRYTIFASQPRFTNVEAGGHAVLGAAGVVLALAVGHVFAHLRHVRRRDEPADEETTANGGEADDLEGGAPVALGSP